MTRTRFETVLLETVVLITFALLVMLALPAQAQHELTDSSTQSAPGIGDVLMGFLTPGSIGAALVALAGLLGSFAFLNTAVRKRRVALAVYHAFHIAEDAGNEYEGEDIFDKGAFALKALDAFLYKSGWRPAKPGEIDLAKLQFSALHGQEIAKAKVAEAAAVAGVVAARPPSA